MVRSALCPFGHLVNPFGKSQCSVIIVTKVMHLLQMLEESLQVSLFKVSSIALKVNRHTSPVQLNKDKDRVKAKWHVRVSKQCCKQANRLILSWALEHKDIFFPLIFFIFVHFFLKKHGKT